MSSPDAAQASSIVPDAAGRLVPRATSAIIATLLLSNAATFMAMPILAVHLAEIRQFDSATVGLILGFYFAAGRITPIFFGVLSDRYGRYRFLWSGLIVRGMGFALYPLAQDPLTCLVFVGAIGLGGASFETASFGLLQGLNTTARERAIVNANLAFNLGVVVGPLMGAGLALLDPTWPFTGAAGLFALIILMLRLMPRLADPRHDESTTIKEALRPFSNPAFRLLIAVMLPWFMLFSQLFVTMPLALAATGDGIEWSNSVFIVNGLVGLVLLSSVSAILRRAETFCILACCYGLAALACGLGLAASDSLVWLLIAVGLFSMAEVVILPGAEIMVTRQAPSNQGGVYFGAFNAVFGLGGALGHFAGSYFALDISLDAAWLAMTMVAMLGLGAALLPAIRRRGAGSPDIAVAP